MKRPSFPFYPKDWLSDLGLRSLPMAARGLWADLMCLMHDGKPYGHLTIDGHPMDDDTAARLVGLAVKEYRGLLAEIERRKVSSRTEAGVLFSRRMVRDEELRQLRADVGSIGGAKTQARGKRFAQAKPQANIEQTINQRGQQTVATATAIANADGLVVLEKGSGEKPNGQIARLVTRLQAQPDRDAVTAMFDAMPSHQDPEAWAGVLLGCLDGLGMPDLRPAPVQAVVAACRDFPALVGAQPWSPRHFRACVVRATAPENPGTGSTWSGTRPNLPRGPVQGVDKITAAAAEFVAGSP